MDLDKVDIKTTSGDRVAETEAQTCVYVVVE